MRKSELERHPWLPGHEHAEGPWCWILANAERIDPPVPWSGMLGIFEVDETEYEVAAADALCEKMLAAAGGRCAP